MNKPGYCLEDKEFIAVHVGGELRDTLTFKGFDSLSELMRKEKNAYEFKNGANHDKHIIPEHTPISNQGGYGSCVANAWCDALEMLDGLTQGDEVEQLSRMFLYATARMLHSALHKDRGTYNKAAAHQLRILGTVEERFYPYETENLYKPPNVDLYTMASNHRITGAYSLTSTGEERLRDIESAIRANHPVVFGTPVGKSFKEYRGGKKVFTPPTSWMGRHAMLVTGVRREEGQLQFYWRNSWGSWWGHNGHAWVDASYMSWEKTSDLWVPTTHFEEA